MSDGAGAGVGMRHAIIGGLTCLVTVFSILSASAVAQEFGAIGSFHNVRSSAGEEPHCYGWSLELWKDGDRLVGLLDQHGGLCGDPPCQTLSDVSYDAKTGRLSFSAFDRRFTGTLKRNEVTGTLGEERVRLKRDKDYPISGDNTLAAWCTFWRTVPRCKGVDELCRGLGIPGH